MTRKEKQKRYEFVKLCSSLTKQGFKFTKQKGVYYALTFPKSDYKRLFNPFIKLPFTDSINRLAGDSKKDCCSFNQWADRKL